MDLIGYLLREHSGVVLTVVAAYLGFGVLGKAWQGASKLTKAAPWWLLPCVAIWALCRRYKSGRRGVSLVSPWAGAGLWAVVFLLAPAWRWWLAGPPLMAALAWGVLVSDRWLQGDWTGGGFKRAFRRDDATDAMRAGMLVATGGDGARVSRATILPDGRVLIRAKVPHGKSVADLDAAARSGRWGAAAGHVGVPLADVKVIPLEGQDEAQVVGRVVGSSTSPLQQVRRHPRAGAS